MRYETGEGHYGHAEDCTIIISDNAPRERGVRARFKQLIPARPRCADNPAHGSRVYSKKRALEHRYIGFNTTAVKRWLTFDIDHTDAARAFENANVAALNIIMLNPANGHGHYAYAIDAPVTNFTTSRTAPLNYLAGIERGMTRRLGADLGYSGALTKNPLHPAWQVQWWAPMPYTLTNLAHWLEPGDMRIRSKTDRTVGLGRNCTIFEDLRHIAYAEVLRFKREMRPLAEFAAYLQKLAAGMNSTFPIPLGVREIAGIVKSIATWTWRKYSPAQFSQIQSARGKRGMEARWAGHVSAEAMRPWEQEGISRRSWYYRRKSQSVIEGDRGGPANLDKALRGFSA